VGSHKIKPLYALVVNGAKELQARRNLELRLVCLDNRAHDSDVYILGADIMRRGDHGDVDV
jgi:hypothetical protein